MCYVKTSLALSLFALLLIVLFNLLIDPFSIYNSPKIEGININKPAFSTHLRMSKAVVVSKIKPSGIILGNSRAENGINPGHSGWNAKSVYNLGLGNANIYEVYRYLQHAHTSYKLKEVVLMLDLVMFNATHNREKKDFDERRLKMNYYGDKQEERWIDTLSPLISFDALVASITTLFNQGIDPKKDRYLANGMVDPYSRQSQIYNQGGHHQVFIGNEKGYLEGPSYNDFSFVSSLRDNWSIYAKILSFAHENNIDLYMAISPSHARMLEVIDVKGLWDTFENWKRKLVFLNEEVSRQFKKPALPLLDFSGYNKYTTEELPDFNDRETKMKWYWESSHFKKELGDLVLDCLFYKSCLDNNRIHEFGIKLTSDTIDSNLYKIREQKKSWRQNHNIKETYINILKNVSPDSNIH
jgi:hypothetical protein